MADYFMNSQLYSGQPDASRFYETIRDAGFGIIKMPPLGIPKSTAAEWVSTTADQIQEYTNRGFKVVIIGFEPLPQAGLWIDFLRAEMRHRRAKIPKVKIITAKETSSKAADRSLGRFLKN